MSFASLYDRITEIERKEKIKIEILDDLRKGLKEESIRINDLTEAVQCLHQKLSELGTDCSDLFKETETVINDLIENVNGLKEIERRKNEN